MDELIRFSGTSNRNKVPILDQPQLVYILCEVVPTSKISAKRLPLNFCLVLDRSGSMMGEKLSTMKEAVKNIIDELEPEDIISIITFESRTDVLVSGLRADSTKKLKQLVDKIQDGGGTNVAPALSAALQIVAGQSEKNRVSRIILLTDGEATDRQKDSFQLADEAGALGIPIICLGLGAEWNEDFLFEISDRSILALPSSHTGMADYIPTPDDVNRIFQDVYESMKIVAQDVGINIRLVQGVEVERAWQVSPVIGEIAIHNPKDRIVQLPIGQLERSGAGFLLEVMIPTRIEGQIRIAQAELSFTIPYHEPHKQSIDFVFQYSGEVDLGEKQNERVTNVVEKVQAYKLQMNALNDVESGSLDLATRKLQQAVTILLAQGEDELAEQLSQEAIQLKNQGDVSSVGRKTILLTSRKTVRLNE